MPIDSTPGMARRSRNGILALTLLLWACPSARAQVPETPAGTSQPSPPAPRVPADPLTPDVQFWHERIRQQIVQRLNVPASLPPDARVEIDVSLLPSGQAADISTRRTSGYPDLDMAVRRAVLAATPIELPADPAGYERVRRFGVVFDAGTGLSVEEAKPFTGPVAPAPPPIEPFLCSAASIGAPAAPDCTRSGSRNDLLTCYAQAVQRRVVKLVSACGSAVYPVEARRNRAEGTVQVAVTFDRGGKLSGVAVAESSGQPLLDQRALDLVREGLVPPPGELFATPFAVRVPVIFRMQRPEPPRGPTREM
jgi:TonB family protein